MHKQADIVVVGSGIAGLVLALEVADHGQVMVLTKRSAEVTNTGWAQGGIAAAWLEQDSWQAHVEDTLTAGAGLCRRDVVEYVAKNARETVQRLIDIGCQFDQEDGQYDLHREGENCSMDALRIQGGTRLSGTLAVDGSKNAALPAMAAATPQQAYRK